MSGALSVLQHNLPAGTAFGPGGTCTGPAPGNQSMLPQLKRMPVPVPEGASTGSPSGGLRLILTPVPHNIAQSACLMANAACVSLQHSKGL